MKSQQTKTILILLLLINTFLISGCSDLEEGEIILEDEGYDYEIDRVVNSSNFVLYSNAPYFPRGIWEDNVFAINVYNKDNLVLKVDEYGRIILKGRVIATDRDLEEAMQNIKGNLYYGN